jgi:O-antigen/teichoic acid export membrane protein
MSMMQRILAARGNTNSVGGQFLMTTGANILMAGLGLLSGIWVARLLGPQGRGELAAIQMWPSLIGGVAMLGLPEALVYFSAREPDRAGSYLASAMTLALLSSIVFMGVGYVAMPFVLSAQTTWVVANAQWYLLLIPLIALEGLPYEPLRGRSDFAAWNMLRLFPGLGWLAVLTLAWMLDRTQPGFLALSFLGMHVSVLLPVILYTVFRRLPGPFWPEVRTWGPMSRYGLPAVLSSVPLMLNLRLDQVLMASFLPAQALGLYVVAVAWSGIMNPLLAALGSVLLPRVAGQSSPEQSAVAFTQGSRMGVLLALVMMVACLIATPWCVPLVFGRAFAAAIPAALVLVVAGGVLGLNLTLEDGLRGLGYPVAALWAELGGLVVTATSLLLLLQSLQIMGAALASLLGYGAVTIILVAQARWLTGDSSATILLPTIREVTLSWQRLRDLMEPRAK